MDSLKTSKILLTVSLFAFLLIHGFLGMAHYALDHGWPMHAYHHNIRAGLGAAGLGVVGILLVWREIHRRFYYWTCVGIFAVTTGAFWIVWMFVPFGLEAERPIALAFGWVQTVSGISGFALAWKHSSAEQSSLRAA